MSPPSEEKVFSLLPDQPVRTGGDVLDYKSYAATLVRIIKDLDPGTPLTVGVFGDWGSGKTTLLQMVEEQLGGQGLTTVWVNVWQLNTEEDLWNAFLQAIVNKVRSEAPPLRQLAFNVRLLWRRLDWGTLPRQAFVYLWRASIAVAPVLVARLIPADAEAREAILAGGGFASVALGFYLLVKPFVEALREGVSIDFGRLLKASPYEDRIAELDQFKGHFEDMVSALVGPSGRVVVFIDDLDRCSPERVVQVLDTIKLFVDIPRGVYVLGLDRHIIEQAVRIKYKDYDDEEEEAREYLEKIIQLPFDLPHLTGDEMQVYVDGLGPGLPDDRCAEVFALGLDPNPRKVKRTINTFLLFWGLAEERKEKLPGIQPLLLSKVVVIQHSHPNLYAVLQDFPGDLERLESYFLESERAQAERALPGEEPPPKETAVQELPALPERLKDFGARGTLKRLFTLPLDGDKEKAPRFAGLSRAELRSYLTLTRSVSAEVAEAPPIKAYEPELVHIPAGPFQMGTSQEQVEWMVAKTEWAAEWEKEGYFKPEMPAHEVQLSEYRMGRTPVTNAEYGAFVRDTGQEPPSHWEAGTYPKELSDHPVVNVSWEAARAYCQWLAEATGRPYRLPTEAEWEKAARGQDGRLYPWGNEFEAAKLNSAESGRDETTPVGQFSPEGDSPYGAADMAGNVWEWCADWYDEREYERRSEGAVQDPQGPEEGEFRVLRGGSFSFTTGNVRCASRGWDDPDFGNWVIGFRVALSPSNSGL